LVNVYKKNPFPLTWAPSSRRRSPSEHLVEPRDALYVVVCGPVAPPALRSAPQTSLGVS
jgi:hypothetical protein